MTLKCRPDCRTDLISTHTLTWSVTEPTPAVTGTSSISTHTLTWSVTHSNANTGNGIEISTHTLTWSVTAIAKG